MTTEHLTPPAPARRATHPRVSAVVAVLVGLTLLMGAVSCSSDDDSDAKGDSNKSTTTAASSESDAPSDSTAQGSSEPADPGDATDRPPVESDANAEDYVEAFSAMFTEPGQSPFPGAEPGCVAKGWVELLGVDTIKAAGLTPEQFAQDGPVDMGLDRSTADELVTAMDACGADYDAFYEALVVSPSGEDAELTAEQAEQLACLKADDAEGALRSALASSLMGETAEMDGIQERWSECTMPAG